MICNICKKEKSEGKVSGGEFICDVCVKNIKTCPDCECKSYVNDQCRKCKFVKLLLTCHICEFKYDSGIHYNGIFKCQDCHYKRDGVRQGFSLCPQCFKYTMTNQDEGDTENRSEWQTKQYYCTKCPYVNKVDYHNIIESPN